MENKLSLNRGLRANLGLSVWFAAVVLLLSGCSRLEEIGPTIWTRPGDDEVAPEAANKINKKSPSDAAPAPGEPAIKESDSVTKGGEVAAPTTQTIEVAPNTVVNPDTKPPVQVAAQTATGAATGPGARVQPVEILWRVPTDTVERYQIIWGNDESNLDQKVTVEVRDLTKVDHPKFGPVFRYELRQVPMDQAIYLSLRAENRFGISAPTPPVRLDPGKRTIAP